MSTTVEHRSVSRNIDGHEVPPAGTYALDDSHTNVGFSARHLVVAKTRGRFASFRGDVIVGEDPFDSHIDVEVDVASVDSRDPKRDEHLRSADFFDVEHFPTMSFHSHGVRPATHGKYTVEGDLTVRGVTRPVELTIEFHGAVTDPWGGIRAGFSASGELNREDFGLTWNQALEGGGVLVGKTVSIEIEAELVLA
jgi:polyisoprenoid-binding protein YceI